MFGHQDDQSQQKDTNQIPQQSIDNAIASDASQTGAMPPAPILPVNAAQPDDDWQHPGSPLESDPSPSVGPASATVPNTPILPPDMSTNQPTDIPEDNSTSPNELIDIKQQALNQLSPLVGHLEQTPEEKFRTTMMMIQASDNQSMIKTAFAAAQAITDEKVRAQALLDVVNEINYFTQNLPNNQQ